MFKSIKWKQTSLLCMILAPLLLITTPMCYYNHGQGIEILAVMWLMFFTDSLALQYYGALLPLVLPLMLVWVYFNWLGISNFLGN